MMNRYLGVKVSRLGNTFSISGGDFLPHVRGCTQHRGVYMRAYTRHFSTTRIPPPPPCLNTSGRTKDQREFPHMPTQSHTTTNTIIGDKNLNSILASLMAMIVLHNSFLPSSFRRTSKNSNTGFFILKVMVIIKVIHPIRLRDGDFSEFILEKRSNLSLIFSPMETGKFNLSSSLYSKCSVHSDTKGNYPNFKTVYLKRIIQYFNSMTIVQHMNG